MIGLHSYTSSLPNLNAQTPAEDRPMPTHSATFDFHRVLPPSPIYYIILWSTISFFLAYGLYNMIHICINYIYKTVNKVGPVRFDRADLGRRRPKKERGGIRKGRFGCNPCLSRRLFSPPLSMVSCGP